MEFLPIRTFEIRTPYKLCQAGESGVRLNIREEDQESLQGLYLTMTKQLGVGRKDKNVAGVAPPNPN